MAVALLEIVDLKKSYVAPDGTGVPVLDVPAFSLEAAAQVGLRGASGSGKTTLLNVIAGIVNADSGSIRLDGQETTKLSEPERDELRARTIGYVFQTFNLLQGYTCLENVLLGMAFGPGKDRDLACELLKRVGLEDRLHYRPRQLSSGQQQRVAVARALANRPRLILADEPTGHLDPRNAGAALELIRELSQENEAALLLVSHDPKVFEAFDDVRELQFPEAADEGGTRT